MGILRSCSLRLVALATDKFVSEVVHEAKALGELRMSKEDDSSGGREGNTDGKDTPALTMGDLAESLRARGVKITKPASSGVVVASGGEGAGAKKPSDSSRKRPGRPAGSGASTGGSK